MLTLQNFISPEREICTEHALYYQTEGAVGFSQSKGCYLMPRGSRINFGTYFNLFNLGNWNRGCQLDSLFAELTGSGKVEIRVQLALPTLSGEVVYSEVVDLEASRPHLIDLSEFAGTGTGVGTGHDAYLGDGVLWVELLALGDEVTVTGGRFATDTQPAAWPHLAVSITTFKREKDVRRTVERLEGFLKDTPHQDNISVQVVDNGKSAEIPDSAKVTSYPNSNLGGAGGFARGLLEAEKGGYSHCLFMDDDASFHMENIARSYMFLALAKAQNTAIAGAMINNTHKWAMWESGAYFDGSCHPLYNGTDLRELDDVIEMALDSSSRPQPETLYGGWWFFAFPIAQVRHHPFPFFVRGDDISFSLANDFKIFTLNGVVSFQDDFTEKESAQTLYLDLRNHLMHHLVFEKLQRSAWGTAKIALRFMMRSMLRFKYDSAEAQLLAWQDVMQGPEFFDRNIDMSERRARIKALISDEAWVAAPPQPPQERHRFSRMPRRLRHYFGIWSLNGHLVPFWSLLGDHKTLDIGDRGLVLPAFGSAELTYYNTRRDKCYTVRQSKQKFFSLAWRMITTFRDFQRNYSALQASYRKGYEGMTQRSYWQRVLAEDLSPEEHAPEDLAAKGSPPSP